MAQPRARAPTPRPASAGVGLFSGTGTVEASADELGFSLSSSYAVSGPEATRLSAVVRTATLYADRANLRVAFQLTDGAGNTDVATSGLTVGFALVSGSLAAAGSCSLLSSSLAGSGVGDCSLTLDASWFEAAATATPTVTASYNGVVVASASPGAVALSAAPAGNSLSAAGMGLDMPSAPLYPGDEFTATLSAHTGADTYELLAWKASLTYDASVLALVSWSFSSAYQILVRAAQDL